MLRVVKGGTYDSFTPVYSPGSRADRSSEGFIGYGHDVDVLLLVAGLVAKRGCASAGARGAARTRRFTG